mmetsp:Transcript_14716/g.18480  ORF Transcript_14716/g.18480 Transcript_14716/m.18480 type:complete len:490 (+) Transcript_14716:575-2044(+)
MAVVLDGEALCGRLPVAADRELLGIVTRPDLDLIDVAVGETSRLHLVGKGLAVAVVALCAEEQVFLATDEDLKVSDEVFGEVTASEVGLDLGEDGGERLGLNVLSGIHTETGEANADQVSHVGSDALADVVTLRIQVSEAGEPAIVELEGVGPGVERSLAVEVRGDVSCVGVLEAWDETSVLRVLISPVVGEVGRLTARVACGGSFSGPVCAPATTAVAVTEDVVASARHVVDDGIGVDSDTSSSASLDHIAKLLAGATTAFELVRCRLIVEPPRVQFTVLRPFVREDRLTNWEDLDAHPALLSKVLALLLDIVVRPAEHFDDCALLAALVDVGLIDGGALPDQVHCLEVDGVGLAAVTRLDRKGQGVGERAVGLVLVAVLEALAVPVVLHGSDARVLAASGGHRGGRSGGIVLNMVIAHDAPQTLERVLVLRRARQVGLEGAVSPVIRVRRHVTRRALQILEEGAVIVSDGADCHQGSDRVCFHYRST